MAEAEYCGCCTEILRFPADLDSTGAPPYRNHHNNNHRGWAIAH